MNVARAKIQRSHVILCVCMRGKERMGGGGWVGEKSREHISLNLLFFLVSAPHHHHATPADIRYQFSSFARR